MIIISFIILLAFLKITYFILFEKNSYQLFEKVSYLFLLTLAPIAAIKLVNNNVDKFISNYSAYWNMYVTLLSVVFFYVFIKKAQGYDELKKREVYKSLIITLIGLLIMYFTRD